MGRTMIGTHRDRERGCGRAREWVSLRADGELSELERLLLRRHLSRCGDCRAFAGAVEVTTRAIRETPQERPSRSLGPVPAPARPRVRLRLAAVALAVGAATAGGVIGGFLGSGSDSPVPTAPGPTEIADLGPDTTERPPPVTTVNV
jgi:ferric-dicitrate binding protein FerR (iron transport regulator)